jgi:hypothetical protein
MKGVEIHVRMLCKHIFQIFWPWPLRKSYSYYTSPDTLIYLGEKFGWNPFNQLQSLALETWIYTTFDLWTLSVTLGRYEMVLLEETLSHWWEHFFVQCSLSRVPSIVAELCSKNKDILANFNIVILNVTLNFEVGPWFLNASLPLIKVNTFMCSLSEVPSIAELCTRNI